MQPPMSESFLHYVWQFQYFKKENLTTTDGEPLAVLKTGNTNTHSGPDFFNAKIKIGEMEWVGNVEVHIKSTDWYAHRHQQDGAYENVVLHVVWQDDQPVFRGKERMATLELKDRVSQSLLTNYQKLINNPASIACEKSFHRVDRLIKLSMLDKTLSQRLEAKAREVERILKTTQGDWEETAYQVLARNFGFNINADPFQQLSKSVPYKIIRKQNSLTQVEALLFGQAGMLPAKNKDEYISLLFREYQLLAQKFSLASTQLNISQWKFLRLRPANFPTLRIAQFAAFLFSVKNIFSAFIESESYAACINFFSFAASGYWQTHYRFGVASKKGVHGLGKATAQNIIINSIAPLLVAYGKHKDEQRYIDRAIDLLQNLPAENNSITRKWLALGLTAAHAADSQAMIELYKQGCLKRLCLNCSIGTSILKPSV